MIAQQRFRLFVLIASLVVLVVSTGAEAQPYLRILPADTCMYVGDVFVVEIYIDTTVVDLMGWDITVSYDEALLDVVDVDEGALPVGSGHTTFFFWLNDGADDGTVKVNGSILGTTVAAPGVLFTITLEAIDIGFTDLCLAYSELRNDMNESIDHDAVCGGLTIEIPIATDQTSWGSIKRTGRK